MAMLTEHRYELKLSTGKTVEWTGTDGENAAIRYVDMYRDAVVVAYRLAYSETHGIHVLGNARQIIG